MLNGYGGTPRLRFLLLSQLIKRSALWVLLLRLLGPLRLKSLLRLQCLRLRLRPRPIRLSSLLGGGGSSVRRFLLFFDRWRRYTPTPRKGAFLGRTDALLRRTCEFLRSRGRFSGLPHLCILEREVLRSRRRHGVLCRVRGIVRQGHLVSVDGGRDRIVFLLLVGVQLIELRLAQVVVLTAQVVAHAHDRVHA